MADAPATRTFIPVYFELPADTEPGGYARQVAALGSGLHDALPMLMTALRRHGTEGVIEWQVGGADLSTIVRSIFATELQHRLPDTPTHVCEICREAWSDSSDGHRLDRCRLGQMLAALGL